MAKRVLVKDLQAEIEGIKEEWQLDVDTLTAVAEELVESKENHEACMNKIEELDSIIIEIRGQNRLLNESIRLQIKNMDDMEAEKDDQLYTRDGIIECQREEYVELKRENTRLINKNEAMQSIMDTIAHAATAGQALIEL